MSAGIVKTIADSACSNAEEGKVLVVRRDGIRVRLTRKALGDAKT